MPLGIFGIAKRHLSQRQTPKIISRASHQPHNHLTTNLLQKRAENRVFAPNLCLAKNKRVVFAIDCYENCHSPPLAAAPPECAKRGSGNVPRRGPVPKFSDLEVVALSLTAETESIDSEKWLSYRFNQKDWKPTFIPFAKARKRIETIFSQLTDQFLVIRNYAKITNGLFARIIGKISALTILQYVNFINDKPIGRIKYALNKFRQQVVYILFNHRSMNLS